MFFASEQSQGVNLSVLCCFWGFLKFFCLMNSLAQINNAVAVSEIIMLMYIHGKCSACLFVCVLALIYFVRGVHCTGPSLATSW